MCAILLVPVVAVVGPLALDPQRRATLLYRPVLFTLLLAGCIVVATMFLLVWNVRSGQLLDKLARAAAQATVLCSRDDRTVLIESTGPLGSVSSKLRPCGVRVARCAGGALYGLEITSEDQNRWTLFIGLSIEELRWIARAVRL